MKEIKFYHPASDYLANPLKDFDPSIVHYYPKEAGLYIYGIRAKVDGALKFIPLVVGESGDLSIRLHDQHYLYKFANPLKNLLGEKCGSSDIKEIWEFSKINYTVNHIQEIYRDMNIYEIHKKIEDRSKLKNLLIYRNAELFHRKLGIKPPTEKKNLKKYWKSVEYLLCLSSEHDDKRKIINYITKLILTFENFRKNFYFVYAPYYEDNLNKEDNANRRRKAEFDTKKQLKELGIHTTAKGAHNDKKTKYSINLSEIQNDLVLLFDNNRANFYKKDKQHYIDNLIIPLAILDENR